ncbi:RND transporter [Thermoclostridium stercorarium subsp. thermolacticum DSM 2910]|jgi:multidrug efflux pump subunit AcrA (membrane-fusion protein)|uniref:RND transporter n=2 Tax=Thermoclostridium stercorarium TaxID=1510 RepID=A0A1B1YP30_THEST|nr:HlyD family efflux transporter periplasmic adaptor subunit [Thermoclostridium stercorarium]ANW99905.1 RND transporter [Thermoclostridium stercorarium subsp. thermolacticum DSM 2910]ANX02530.1 RND transporter [Thermoclostridium stercorarium subsp. leptospartum DSM 9219]UZQ85623.1 efflux RND transporter periplasmic adaptor subunit [Thermoclostridium stercorarium]
MGGNGKKKRRIWIIIGIVAVLASVLISYFAFRPADFSYEKVTASINDIITYYSFSGNVASKNRQSVYAEKIMQVSEIYVEKGSEVKAGDVLLKSVQGDEVKAKINGEVVALNVEENKQVAPGTLLAEIVDYNSLEVVFKVDEYDVGAINADKEATVYIHALNKEFKGKIREISKEGQIANGVTFYTAAIDIEQDGSIRTGMSAEVRLVSDRAEKVVTLPMHVIYFDEQNRPYVLKKGRGNTVIKQEITTGINDGTYVEIKSGVSEGEEVLYKNDLKLETLLFPEGGKNIRLYPKGDNDE